MSPIQPWPRVVPKPGEPGGTPTDPIRSQLVTGANGRPLPIIFGPRIATGIMSDVWPHGNGLVYCFKFCVGPIKSYQWIKLNGKLIGGVIGIGYTEKRGTLAQTAGALLVSAHGAGYYERFPLEAYVEVGVDYTSDVLGSNIQLQAYIEGLENVYDHRTETTGYSQNPAVCAAHLMLMPQGGHRITASDIHWDSWDAGADWCDELIEAGDKRWELSAIVDSPATVLQHVTNILASCRMRPVWRDGKIGLVWNDDAASVTHTLDLTWIAAAENGRGPLQLREYTTTPEQHPTVVTVSYPDLSRLGENVNQTVKAPGVDAGTLAYRESQVSSAHITRVAVAARLADDLMLKAQADLRCWALCMPRAHIVQPGERVAFSGDADFMDLATTEWMVDEALLRPDGLVELTLSEPFSNSEATREALSTGSIYVDRVDPKSPNVVPSVTDAIPPLTGLTLTTLEFDDAGVVTYAIYATWTRSPSLFVTQYNVVVTVDSDEVWVGSFPAQTTECTIPVRHPGMLHTVEVTPVSPSGRSGGSDTETITPGVATPTVTLGTGNSYTVNALLSESASVLTRGTLYTCPWSVTANAASIWHFVLYDDNGDFAVLDATSRSARITPIAQIDSPVIEDYVLHVANGDIGMRVVLTDGREIDKGAFSFTASGISAEQLGEIDDEQLFRWDEAQGTMRPFDTTTPAIGSMPYKWSGGWGWLLLTGDNGTIPAGSANTTVEHGLTFSTSSYLVIVCSRDGTPVWAEPISTTQIRVYRSGTSGDQAFSYLVAGA